MSLDPDRPNRVWALLVVQKFWPICLAWFGGNMWIPVKMSILTASLDDMQNLVAVAWRSNDMSRLSQAYKGRGPSKNWAFCMKPIDISVDDWSEMTRGYIELRVYHHHHHHHRRLWNRVVFVGKVSEGDKIEWP